MPQLEKLMEKMRQIGGKYDASPAQVAAAWAIAKGTLPIIGVTKVEQVEAAAKAAEIVLTAEEVSELEALGDAANINTLREWEKEMI
jgi:aryl-alcohol dehydrogenase-like predicted oxidoreductase